MTATTQRTNLIAPSPVFYALLASVVVTGVLLWNGTEYRGTGIFLFVIAGWVLSLALHEFGHAIVAYYGGDRSVVDKGYLTLDVRKYVDPMTSLVFPIGILLIGGIGLPGGAVWINTGAIRSPLMRSLMSAAGPAASALCALICLLPIKAGWVDAAAHPQFVLGLSFLGSIQIIAVIFNLLPVPGLDGYGIIEPHLTPAQRTAMRPYSQYGIMIVIAAIWFLPPVADVFWSITDFFSDAIGGDLVRVFRTAGFREFQFWE